MNRKPLLLGLLAALALPACTTTSTSTPEMAAREAAIAAEPAGAYFVGRRYFIDTTRFWGYLREPGKPWATAKLVVMNEARVKVPDRLPEVPADGGPAHGYDNNFEYRVTGHYTGRGVYDPNSNLTLPEFFLTGMQISTENPGYLFSPRQRYKPDSITIYPGTGVPEHR